MAIPLSPLGSNLGAPLTAIGRGCVKTLQAHFVRCIFSRLRSISCDFVGSNPSAGTNNSFS